MDGVGAQSAGPVPVTRDTSRHAPLRADRPWISDAPLRTRGRPAPLGAARSGGRGGGRQHRHQSRPRRCAARLAGADAAGTAIRLAGTAPPDA